MINFNWNIDTWLIRYKKKLESLLIERKYLLVLLKPIKELHTQLLALKADFDLRMRYCSQQMSFAAVLNKIFDPINKRIRVITGSDAAPGTFTYFESETSTPIYTYFDSEGEDPLYTYFDSENNNDGLVIFFIPSSLSVEEARIRSWIKYYLLADKKYQIIYE